MNKVISAMCFMGVLTSCSLFVESMPKSWKWGATPRPLTGIRNFPSADTDYGKGFKDGCGSAWDAVTKGLLSDKNNRDIDPSRMGTNPDYSTGWFDGFEQCTYIMDWDVT